MTEGTGPRVTSEHVRPQHVAAVRLLDDPMLSNSVQYKQPEFKVTI